MSTKGDALMWSQMDDASGLQLLAEASDREVLDLVRRLARAAPEGAPMHLASDPAVRHAHDNAEGVSASTAGDRVAAAGELDAAWADAEAALPDGWRIRRGSPRGAGIRTGGDHRIAMAFAVAALAGVAGRVTIDEPDCVAVSYPGFWDHLAGAAG